MLLKFTLNCMLAAGTNVQWFSFIHSFISLLPYLQYLIRNSFRLTAMLSDLFGLFLYCFNIGTMQSKDMQRKERSK